MNWTEQRQGQEWNAEGQCAREACRGDITGVRYFNSSIRLHYCETCAVLINKHNPGLCTVDFQEPTLNQALAERGFTTAPGVFHGQKSILKDGEVVFEGTAHDVWLWLNGDE